MYKRQGPDVADDPAVEEPVMEKNVPPGLVDAGLDTAVCPDTPEIDEPDGQGLSSTPEGGSGSLPCGQRVATPESSDSSFEVISDTLIASSECDGLCVSNFLYTGRITGSVRSYAV